MQARHASIRLLAHASHPHPPHQDRRHARSGVGQPDQMTALLDAGVDVVRINASHGTPEIRARWIEQLREVTEQPARGGGRPVRSPGPPHPGRRAARAAAARARARRSSSRPRPRRPRARFPRPTTISRATCASGARILLDDGLLALEVTRHSRPAGRRGRCTTAASSRRTRG